MDPYETYAEAGIVVAILGTLFAIAFNLSRTRFDTTSRFRILHALERSDNYLKFSKQYTFPELRKSNPRWNAFYLPAVFAVGLSPLVVILFLQIFDRPTVPLQVGILWFVVVSFPAALFTAIEWRKFENAVPPEKADKQTSLEADSSFILFSDIPAFVSMSLFGEGAIVFTSNSGVAVESIVVGLSVYLSAAFLFWVWDLYRQAYGMLWNRYRALHPDDKVWVELRMGSSGNLVGYVLEMGKRIAIADDDGRITELDWSSVDLVTVLRNGKPGTTASACAAPPTSPSH